MTPLTLCPRCNKAVRSLSSNSILPLTLTMSSSILYSPSLVRGNSMRYGWLTHFRSCIVLPRRLTFTTDVLGFLPVRRGNITIVYEQGLRSAYFSLTTVVGNNCVVYSAGNLAFPSRSCSMNRSSQCILQVCKVRHTISVCSKQPNTLHHNLLHQYTCFLCALPL